MTVNDRNSNRFAAMNVPGLGLYLFSRTVTYSRSMTITTYHHRHHFICPIINSVHIYSNTILEEQTARSDENTNSCPKTCNKTVTGYIGLFYHTSKILRTRKLEKSIFSIVFLKTFKDAKFTVDDGSAFQTFLF